MFPSIRLNSQCVGFGRRQSLLQSSRQLRCNSSANTSSSGRSDDRGYYTGSLVSPDEGGSTKALPNGTLWRLNNYEHLYYDVRGASFVIQRAESSLDSFSKRSLRRLHQRPTKLSVRRPPAGSSSQAGLIMQAVRAQPIPLVMYNGHPVVDVTSAFTAVDEPFVELDAEEEDAENVAPTFTTAPVSEWGLVPVEQEKESEEEEEEEPDVYVTTSSSPRRTHMIGFTCHRCGARCHNAVNPSSFHDGTLAACCGKCKTWHKITDKFNIFGYDLKGDEFVKPSAIDAEDIPPSLRLPLQPFYWNDDASNN